MSEGKSVFILLFSSFDGPKMKHSIIHDDDKNFCSDTPIEKVGPILNSIGVSVFVIGVIDNDRFLLEFVNGYYDTTFNIKAADTTGLFIEDTLPSSSAEMSSAITNAA